MTCSRWLPNSTNLDQSQLSNTKPPAMYRKRRFEWSFRAAPHARLSAAPRASLAPLQRVHVLRVQLCLPNHPMLVTRLQGAEGSLGIRVVLEYWRRTDVFSGLTTYARGDTSA